MKLSYWNTSNENLLTFHWKPSYLMPWNCLCFLFGKEHSDGDGIHLFWIEEKCSPRKPYVINFETKCQTAWECLENVHEKWHFICRRLYIKETNSYCVCEMNYRFEKGQYFIPSMFARKKTNCGKTQRAKATVCLNIHVHFTFAVSTFQRTLSKSQYIEFNIIIIGCNSYVWCCSAYRYISYTHAKPLTKLVVWLNVGFFLASSPARTLSHFHFLCAFACECLKNETIQFNLMYVVFLRQSQRDLTWMWWLRIFGRYKNVSWQLFSSFLGESVFFRSCLFLRPLSVRLQFAQFIIV